MTTSPYDVAHAFGLNGVEPKSLTRFAPVYRAQATHGSDVVMKRTPGNAQQTAALVQWITALQAADVAVVTPVSLGQPNPAEIGGQMWVVYPWIDGATYQGTHQQVHAAGDLLGRMHAAEVPTAGLRTYSYPDTGYAEVTDDFQTLQQILTEQGAPEAMTVITELGQRWWHHSLPALQDRDAELPRTAVSSDYKASNLVYSQVGPVLIDPDNGGLEPRIFDLALAVTLFHTECQTAPGRTFTTAEWAVFRDAYLQHVQLTEAETELWPAALDHMLWEEGTWAIEDSDAEDWADQRQRDFLLNLAQARPENFPLD